METSGPSGDVLHHREPSVQNDCSPSQVCNKPDQLSLGQQLEVWQHYMVWQVGSSVRPLTQCAVVADPWLEGLSIWWSAMAESVPAADIKHITSPSIPVFSPCHTTGCLNVTLASSYWFGTDFFQVHTQNFRKTAHIAYKSSKTLMEFYSQLIFFFLSNFCICSINNATKCAEKHQL